MSLPLTQAEAVSTLEGLSSADAEVRRLSAEQLLRLPMEEALPRLMECLGDSDWRVRKAAVAGLVRCREVDTVAELLVDALGDGENSGRRNAAFEALVGLGTGASPWLVRSIESPDVDVRKLVVDAMAAIGDPETRRPLVSALVDEDPNVRAAVAEALGVVGTSAEVSSLLGVAENAEEETLARLSALRALSCLEADVSAGALADPISNLLLRSAVFELLGYSQDSAAWDVLLKGLSETRRSSREAAMSAVLRWVATEGPDRAAQLRSEVQETVASDDSIIEFACERLEAADLPRRIVFIQFLGLLQDSRGVVPILVAGRDEALIELSDATLESFGGELSVTLVPQWDELDYDLKVRACGLLGSLGGERAEELLSRSLVSPDGELRCAAATALGKAGYLGQLPELVRCLEFAAGSEAADVDDEVPSLVSAIACLADRAEMSGSAAGAQIVELLTSRLGGASVPVRLAIAKVLARVGRAQDQDVIGYLLKDASPEVRRSAVQAMARFDFASVQDSLRLAQGDESGAVRIAAAQVLGDTMDPGAREDLVRLLGDPDPAVVAVSVRALGRIGASLGEGRSDIFEQIAPTLQAVPIVALAGIEALMLMGGEGAAELALGMLDHPEPDVIRAALAVVGTHGTLADLVEASPLVEHADWSVRAEIIETLGTRSVKKGLPVLLRRLSAEQDSFVRDAIMLAIQRLEE